MPLNMPGARICRGVLAGGASTGPAERIRPGSCFVASCEDAARSGGCGGEGPDVLGGQWLARDSPVTAADFLDHDPGDLAHALAFDGDHRVGEFLDHPALLLGGEHVLDELDVDERHFSPWLVVLSDLP